MGRVLEGKRVVVIGTGIGGAGIAGLLAYEGAKVNVFERNSIIGGKTATLESDHYFSDIGVHISPRGEKGPCGELARRIQADLTFLRKEPTYEFIFGEGTHRRLVGARIVNPVNLIKLVTLFRPSPLDVLNAARFFRKLLGIETIDDVKKYCGLSIRELLDNYKFRSPRLNIFFDVISAAAMGLAVEKGSAAKYLYALATSFKAASISYPKGGFANISGSYLKVCKREGGRVHLNEPVTRICVEKEKVKGVETKGGFYEADLVISNAGIKKTVELSEKGAYPETFKSRVNHIQDTHGGIVVQYGLDYTPTRAPLTIYFPDGYNGTETMRGLQTNKLPGDVLLFVVTPTLADPGLAPPGKSVVLSGTMTPADMFDSDLNNGVFHLIQDRMEALFPGIEDHVIWKKKRGIPFMSRMGGREGELVGYAQRFDQDGANRLSPKMPVEGLYIVGTDGSNGMGIGTELAAESALDVHQLIMQDLVPCVEAGR